MNPLDLNESFYMFVKEHKRDDLSTLILKYKEAADKDSIEFVLTQIECRKKCANKLKPFLVSDRFLFADSLSAEQSSDYRVASYHADIVGKGKEVIDLTAGLGIDAMTVAGKGNGMSVCEINEMRCRVLRHNAALSGLDDFTIFNTDCIEYLKTSDRRFDVIFIDPARRSNDNRRVYGFRDCEPDILENMDLMKKHADRIIIKASPLLDITQTIRDLEGLESIHIVSVKGECKEVLAILSDNVDKNRNIRVVDLSDEGIDSSFEIDFESFLSKESCDIASEDDVVMGKYLYVPNAGMMKIDAGAILCSRFDGMKKISPNTNLYVSDKLYDKFPGGIHKIIMIPDKKDFKGFKNGRYNVSTRNYPVETEVLRKKLKVKEGLESFILGFRAFKKGIPTLVVSERIRK